MSIAANSTTAVRDLQQHVSDPDHVIYLPNYYPRESQPFLGPIECIIAEHPDISLDIGCFGALRPLKNQLIQASAAIQYANKVGRRLRFGIDRNRAEQGGDSNLRNIRALFVDTRHELIEHGRLDHLHFLRLVGTMDLVMQVSLTETFCIVAADAVTMNVPIVVSSEIDWASRWSKANATDTEDIVKKIGWALGPARRWIRQQNRDRLVEAARWAKYEWTDYLAG